MIDCRVLGPVDVVVDGAAAPAELLWRKNLGLLVYLARSPRRSRTRDHLVGLFWGDKAESAARHSLNEALRVLRRCAGEEGIESAGDQVRLAEGALLLDTDRFEERVSAEDWAGAAELMAGEFMEGFVVPGSSELEDWLSAERLTWRQRGVDALVRHAEQLIDAGGLVGAVEIGGRALALDPTSDPAARTAMRAVALSGDRGAALAIYDAFAARLEEELDADPEPATAALADRVRREKVWQLPASAIARPGRGAESRRVPLVGRERELARLLEAWESCRATGRAALAVIEGDPGTGKTRLAEEITARARLEGAFVVAVRAVEADLETPGAGARAVVRALAEGTEDTAPASEGPRISDRLEPALTRGATVLWVDDAQWLDRDSLLAIGATLRDFAERPLLAFLTHASQPPRPELDELRAHLGRDLEGVAVRIGPLTREGLRALARWALPDYSEVELDRVTRRVATDSAGLPLLAVELLHAVALGLDLAQTAGAWPAPSRTLDQTLPGGLPDAVVAAIRVGFRRLSPDAQTVLAAASVLPSRTDVATLARAADLPPETLSAALDELEWNRWLIAEPRGYTFLARVVREVVARDMTTAGQRKRYSGFGDQ